MAPRHPKKKQPSDRRSNGYGNPPPPPAPASAAATPHRARAAATALRPRRAEQGRTAGARSKGARPATAPSKGGRRRGASREQRRGLELGHGGATAARQRTSRGAAAEALARRPGAAERAAGERPRVGRQARCGQRVAAAAARSPSERRSASSAALTPLPFLTRSVLTRSASWRRSTSPTLLALEVSATEQCIYARWIWLRLLQRKLGSATWSRCSSDITAAPVAALTSQLASISPAQ
ncbi:splicing factor, arginine/serine-rich 19-like isoform X1 [Panicum virgatum]|uniref:splicing factor, arginine/serine-rich 19-like isoform X1 n=1 Tax=Panicum virgatum TaxID=38727 RepID=UPI0019D51195|nr:splicing factor, arginine/serine-rich 19-like isoform X1 [Panicum virgatum]